MVPPVREKERGLRGAVSAGHMCAHPMSAPQGGQCVRRTAPEWTISMLRLLVVGLLGILTKQHAPEAMGTPQNYDSRIYNCCAPWKGARGSSYLVALQALTQLLTLRLFIVPSDSMSRSSRLRGGMCAESTRVAGASTLQHLWLSVSRYTSVTAPGKVGMLVCGP